MIHKEGIVSLVLSVIVFALVLGASYLYFPVLFPFLAFVFSILFFLLVWFFRNPTRNIPEKNNAMVYAPADGKVVTIEKVEESEYLKDARIQVSIFMSPLNVHVNRNPVSGTVRYAKYHPGKYLVAWHPKSSTENERTTTVIDTGKHQVLFRQIAGALARRIVQYVKQEDKVEQGAEMGFIKLGSRVDVFLPLDSEILVKEGDKVSGALDVIAKLK